MIVAVAFVGVARAGHTQEAVEDTLVDGIEAEDTHSTARPNSTAVREEAALESADRTVVPIAHSSGYIRTHCTPW